MLFSSLTMIGAGFSLGLLHAFDADHVMAVSTLSTRKPSFKSTIKQGLHWALGHGGILLLCGLLLFGIGFEIPATFQSLAEASVGVLLILIGALCLKKCRQQSLKLVRHTHGDIEHTHWQIVDRDSQKPVQENDHNHAPAMVGMLHGLAGSAPALALVPAMASGDLISALTYLLIFSLGVLIAMMTFSMGLGATQKYLLNVSARLFQYMRYGISLVAMAFGGYWLMQAI